MILSAKNLNRFGNKFAALRTVEFNIEKGKAQERIPTTINRMRNGLWDHPYLNDHSYRLARIMIRPRDRNIIPNSRAGLCTLRKYDTRP